MSFYEIIYEPGTHSIAEYKDDEEALEAVNAHHKRALAGEEGGPTGHAAERVVRILKYDDHPASLNDAQVLDVSEVIAAVKDKATQNLVSIPELASELRALTDPVVVSGPHESNYRAEEVAELDWSGE